MGGTGKGSSNSLVLGGGRGSSSVVVSTTHNGSLTLLQGKLKDGTQAAGEEGFTQAGMPVVRGDARGQGACNPQTPAHMPALLQHRAAWLSCAACTAGAYMAGVKRNGSVVLFLNLLLDNSGSMGITCASGRTRLEVEASSATSPLCALPTRCHAWP